MPLFQPSIRRLTPRQIYHITSTAAAPLTHTGDTNETTKITTTLPAGSIGPNGRFIFRILASCTVNDADVKQVRTYIDGTLINTITLTSMRAGEFELTLSNRGVMSSQTAKGPVHASAYSISSIASVIHSFDFSTALPVTSTLTLGSAGDQLELNAFTIEAVYGV